VISKVRGERGRQDCQAFPGSQRYARIMSSQTLARPSKRKRKKASRQGPGWIAWWPLLAGIAATFAAVRTAEILPLMGTGGLLRLELLYPYALLLKQPLLGLSEQTSNSWSQIMLYAQFPLYGLYASVATRWKPLWTVLLQIAAIHLLGFGALWLLMRL
jgi:hypothetical protein